MKIEAAIHALWAADEILSGLVPAERVTTGPAHGPAACPYVVLLRGPDQPVALASGGARLESARVALDIWANDLDQAQSIAQAAQAVFDRAAFDFEDGAALDMRPVGRQQTVHPDAISQIVLEYDVLVQPVAAET